ncbi:2-C-methyl-D-erythritol 4-phosphate cytidylyltransferase [Myceligenerans pegani]|uniref:2-C-methyl-D-erythritol 4-phosphate cytidylyltransferase n=1 Tax=Myceligenerans pegani TaxID=2776917 RepID=A0ABR9MVV5_9MICO|nr:2-C-methyl-D-erythritol 4-phosphate cytidylyltransferase [Myceligenerans sp. TRM 65318]MBE1875186.1 2-C-methyl-D-erythritol 4-phosphate cytidylyltransferase [Myceligenerans sp. TRM 65318]MBE3017457.1 2-C-methyl-D-erythritol 4-phosphate cytidylyltransferase [Myceligenerans sp. TRM 65318]
MTTLAILTAAGSGARLGRDLPKALVDLGGFPLVLHAARRLVGSGVVDALVVTAPDGLRDVVADLLITDAHVTVPVTVVDGGPTRQASVAAGLAVADASHDVVLVHDAARPLVPADLVRRVDAAVRAGHDAVVPGLPVTDTVKQVVPGDDVELVVGTPDRAWLRAVQTPQGFTRELLERAHKAGRERSGSEAAAATDDAGLVEALGEPVHIVRGDAAAAKITTERDLRMAALELED